MISTILLVAAFILAILAAARVPSPIDLGWLGFAFYLLSLLVGSGLLHGLR